MDLREELIAAERRLCPLCRRMPAPCEFHQGEANAALECVERYARETAAKLAVMMQLEASIALTTLADELAAARGGK